MAWAIKKFYVTMKRGDKTAWLAGPYDTHIEAIDKVQLATLIANDVDPRSHWDAFGTSSIERYTNDHPQGVLNERMKLAIV